jgi:hypothetical protein
MEEDYRVKVKKCLRSGHYISLLKPAQEFTTGANVPANNVNIFSGC